MTKFEYGLEVGIILFPIAKRLLIHFVIAVAKITGQTLLQDYIKYHFFVKKI